MKKIYFLLLGTTSLLSAQVTLEHEYEFQNLMQVNLEISGEKYVAWNHNAAVVELFNADHTLWKTISLGEFESNVESVGVFNVSETLFDADPSIEIAFDVNTSDPESYSGVRIMKENGEILFTVPAGSNFSISDDIGLSPKFIVTQNAATQIYGLPGFVPENSSDVYLERVNLDVSGEKYFAVSGNIVEIYNPDLTLWKSVTFPNMVALVRYITENVFDNDTDLEIVNSYFDGSGFQTQIIDEASNVLLTLPTSFAGLSTVQDFPTKFIAYYISETGVYQSSVYSCNPLAFEHTYDEYIGRNSSTNTTQMYFTVDSPGGVFNIYSSDHTLYKTVSVPDQQVTFSAVSRSFFNPDNLLEFTYGRDSTNELFVYNEDGTLLQTISGYSSGSISRLGDLPEKFIARNSTFTKHGIFVPQPDLATEETAQPGNRLWPNPATSTVNFSSSNLKSAAIYDSTGKLVANRNIEFRSLSVSDLPTGLYFIRITDVGNNQTTHKLIISK